MNKPKTEAISDTRQPGLAPATCYAALCAHVAQMAPHQRERKGGQLLATARDEIGRKTDALLKLRAMIAGEHLACRMKNGDELLAVIAEALKPPNAKLCGLRGDEEGTQ